MKASMSAEIPGHHMDCFALRRDLCIPWCPAWILARISHYFEAGMTTWVPLSRRLSLRLRHPRTSHKV